MEEFIKDKTKESNDNLANVTPSKVYYLALEEAVITGAVSIPMLQKKLEVDYKTASQIIEWLIEQGYVKDDSVKDGFKTTLITEEDYKKIKENCKISTKTKREKQKEVSLDLYKACLRLTIKKNDVNEQMLINAFAIGKVKARSVLQKMCEDGFVGKVTDSGRRQIFITQDAYDVIFEDNNKTDEIYKFLNVFFCKNVTDINFDEFKQDYTSEYIEL